MHDQPSQAKAAQLQAELQQFIGDLQRYRHPLNQRVLYTPGVKYLADEAGAYWLIDTIASWIGSHLFNEAVQRDQRLQTLQFWKLAVDLQEHKAVLTAVADSGEPAFITQQIGFTDFPLAEQTLYAGFDGRYWTIYLPSEH